MSATTPYERTYGYLYDKNRTVKDDAANMRRHIRTMTKAELLPADWTYSVRYRTASMCCAIDLVATSPRPIYAADPNEQSWAKHYETGEFVIGWKDKLTREARAVLDTLTDLHNGHNHDGSDIQSDYFDVKFYGVPSLAVVSGVLAYDPARAS